MATLAVACAATPPPFPQALLVVDTDLPVPGVATHLRVDVFDGTGRWRESRDLALRNPSDYPASFSLYLSDERLEAEALVRLRLRPDGAERDYRGERYRPPPADDAPPEAVMPIPPGDGQPRLIVDGADRTPAAEPLPELTVDRLVRVELRPGTAPRLRVTLRGACAGRMASVADRASCVDATRLWEDAGPGDGPDDGGPSQVGAFVADAVAPVADVPDGATAIRGGAFVLGGDDLPVSFSGVSVAPSYPPRLAVVHSFAMDRTEVSVARLRDALARGFSPSFKVRENPGALATSSADPLASCTYRATPDPADPGREELPVTCVPLPTAREFCRFEGGDLPTEAQWEYAATAAGRARKARFPWGEDPAQCAGVCFGRFDNSSAGSDECFAQAFPFGLRDANTVWQDVTPDGIRGLAGAAWEWVLGAPLPYDSACYQRAGLVDPVCEADGAAASARGGDFGSPRAGLVAVQRLQVPAGGSTPLTGFRCVYGP
jgi:formylglycine-generating enzyme required for sulfatase activity